jgi:hypothetical protein
MVDTCGTQREMINACKILVVRPGRRKLLQRLRLGWEDNIEKDVVEGVGWFLWAQDRVQWQDVVNTVMNLRVP